MAAILACEDNPVLAMHLELIVEDAGHRHLGVVGSMRDALARCAAEPPDLVLVDLSLDDGFTGAELTRRLAETGIPSIIVSGQVATLDEPHAASAVIEKPVRAARLVAAMERTLAAQRVTG